MRVGIVGSGFMGSTHAAGWAETPAEIAGFTAKPVQEAEELAKLYQAAVYKDYETLLADVDVVDICTPTFLHYGMVIKAAEAGKDIVCEKPLSLTVAEGQKMISACEKAGVKLLVGHVVRYFPEYAAAKQSVEEGKIGETAVIRLGRKSFQPKKASANWYLDISKSGGMLMDLMIHDYDYARWVAGDVVQVYAKSIRTNFEVSPFDHALVILTHESGAISHIEGAWSYPAPMFVTDFEIAGSEGLITHKSQETAPIGIYMHSRPGGETPDVAVPSSPLSESPYTTEIKSFYGALKNNTSARVSPGDALAAVQIACAAIESAQTGKAIRLEPLPEVKQ